MKRTVEEDVFFGNAYSAVERECRNCGKPYILWFNGGELDSHICSCGTRYSLQHGPISLIEDRNDLE